MYILGQHCKQGEYLVCEPLADAHDLLARQLLQVLIRQLHGLGIPTRLRQDLNDVVDDWRDHSAVPAHRMEPDKSTNHGLESIRPALALRHRHIHHPMHIHSCCLASIAAMHPHSHKDMADALVGRQEHSQELVLVLQLLQDQIGSVQVGIPDDSVCCVAIAPDAGLHKDGLLLHDPLDGLYLLQELRPAAQCIRSEHDIDKTALSRMTCANRAGS